MAELAQGTNRSSKPAKGNNGGSEPASVKICGHSRLVYWWPVWFFGILLAIYNSAYGDQYLFEQLQKGPSVNSLINLCYLFLILFVVFVTNVRLGLATTVIIMLLFCILLMYLYMALHFRIFEQVPAFLVFVNVKFLLVFSGGLFVIWFIAVVVIDRWHYSLISPGELKNKKFLKGHDVTLEEVVIEDTKTDIPCHVLIGLGLFGDISIGKQSDPKKWENVFMAGKKAEQARAIKRRATGGR